MSSRQFAEYFILGLPYLMGLVFVAGMFCRYMIWYTTKRHEWFSAEFEKRVTRYIDAEKPGPVKNVSFYTLSKRLLERTYYESFALRDRLKRRKGDKMMALSDRIFLVKPGCAYMVRDILNQLKFLKWTNDTPKLLQITRSTFHKNPCFNRVFGLVPVAAANDLVSLLPGLFVITGILGTFVGIAGGLQELGGMNLQDLENTKNIMDRFLQEIAFAMKTSIVGIVFSLGMHIWNTLFSPERVFFSMVDRFETSLDLLWYRADNNEYPHGDKDFDEHRDPVEALAEDAVNAEAKRYAHQRGAPAAEAPKAS
ncbi:MAG: hypothetical protein KF799_01295 [Bdellovibrionales bacterium]|nr:hypothetical protein [Bdellovibrionales bacterium]